MARVHNFAAGPAAMPEEVLQACADEMLDYRDCGMSVMEMSHRTPEFQAIADAAEATLRRLMSIPDNYRVIFMQGGATLQFAAVPLNLMRTGHAGYVVSGNFAKKAWEEGARFGQADVLATSEPEGFDRIPALAGPVDQTLDYVHICQNNTIYGTMFHELPDVGDVPLVADVSSCFLSMPIDVERYGMIYAGVQKNAGPGGMAVAIVRDDLLADGPALAGICPTYLSLRLQADKGSMYNTPNCWGIYVCGKIFDWVEKNGGLEQMGKRNWTKVNRLYDYLDQSSLFAPFAQKDSRSIANVTFRCPTTDLDNEFITSAKEAGIVGVKAHRITGGMRASCYNAVPEAAVEALLAHMAAFEAAHARSSRSM